MSKKPRIGPAAMHIFFCVVLALGFSGCRREPLPAGDEVRGGCGECADGEGGECAAREHGEGAVQEHGEGGHCSDPALSIEEILSRACEHDRPAYTCAECRYEVGVVKVNAHLAKGVPGVGEGLVRTVSATRRTVHAHLDVTGEVQLNQNTAVHISPRIAGVIHSVNVDIGARVRRGDVLFDMDSVELGRAISDYERNRAMVDLSRKNYLREESLFGRKIASERDMIEAQMAYAQYKAELKAAQRKLRALGLAQRDIAVLEKEGEARPMGRLPTVASMDGTVIDKHAVIGERVEPGKVVMLLADLSTVWAWVDIYERDLGCLLEARREGPIPVEIHVHAFPDQPFRGEIDYIGATMEEQTRTVKVRATVRNEKELLRPGMFCQVRILLPSTETVLAVPKAALLSDEGFHFVFRHMKDEYYVRRAVKKGREFDDSVEILDGLGADEIVIADGAFLMKSDVLREKMGAGCAD